MIEEATEKLRVLLEGKIPEEFDIGEITGEQERDLAVMVNRLINLMQEVHDFIIPLSKGELAEITTAPRGFFGSPFKELHSCLLHLTWQAEQVASGDYSQRVDFMGDFSEAFNHMIVSLDRNERLLKKKIDELEEALSHIKKLEGFLPICSACKRVRLEGADPSSQDSWIPIESYLSHRTEATFSHGMCPECMKKFYPDFV
jgi:sigma-B regulation protein RsbU (phosphoserine phosphatase)